MSPRQCAFRDMEEDSDFGAKKLIHDNRKFKKLKDFIDFLLLVEKDEDNNAEPLEAQSA